MTLIMEKVVIDLTLDDDIIDLSEDNDDNDSFTLNDLRIYLKSYFTIDNTIKLINTGLKNKKCRRINFPSEISENIVKFILLNIYNKKCTWDTKCGDLLFDNKYKIEVKSFTSDGPISFGPEENWDIIYFLDSRQYYDDIYILYELKLKNTDDDWKNLKVSNVQSFYQQCVEKRRPRICFDKIFNNFQNKINIVFNGSIKSLLKF